VSLQYETFRTIIDSHSRFVLTTHVNPDGDGLGSEIALAVFLEKRGKQATILNHSPTPNNYMFLEDLHPILWFDAARHASIVENAEVILVVDTNHPDRLMTMKPFVESSNAVKVCIDHHLDPEEFADLYILDEPSTAAGEIIYRLISFLTDRAIDREIAVALYTAIMTDTGSFRYPKTDPEVHKIIAHLIQAGADPVAIHDFVYERNPINRIHLLGMALANIQLSAGGRIAYIILTKDMFKITKTYDVDTDIFVPYTLNIHGVQIGLLFSELEDTIKINFRSKGDIWVNELAKEFGGNGHKNAAGARLPDAKLAEVVPLVLEHAAAYLE
jgi:phosphoesterase RecJ-like protein